MNLFRTIMVMGVGAAALFCQWLLAQSASMTLAASTSAAASLPVVLELYGATAVPSGQEAELITNCLLQLKSDNILSRHNAHQKLRNLGPKASDAITAALADKSYPREAIERMKDIIAWIEYPPVGAVWRQVENLRPNNQFQDGDIVVIGDGKKVDDLNSLRAIVPRYDDYEYKFIVRRDNSNVELKTEIKSICGGFRNWPDDVSIYRIYSPRGKWDSPAEAALRNLGGKNRQERFKEAFDAGCTDAWFMSRWVEYLQQNGESGKAEELLPKLLAATDGSSGGFVRYGWGPVQAACTLIQCGKRSEAQKLVEASLVEGQKVGAWQGVPILARYYISFMMAESYEAGMKAWEQWRDYALATPGDWTVDIQAMMTHLVACNEGVSKAQEFMAKLPPSPSANELKKYYAEQRDLSVRTHAKIGENLVPVFSMPSNFFSRSVYPNHGSFATLLAKPDSPGRLTFKVRMVDGGADSLDSSFYKPASKIKLVYGNAICRDQSTGFYQSTSDVDMWFAADGKMGVSDRGMNSSDANIEFFKAHELRTWHAVAMDIFQGRIRVFIDGKLVRDIHSNKTGPFAVCVANDGGVWEFSEFRYHVYVDEKFDNEAICQLWDQLGKSVSVEPDAKKAAEMRDKLQAVLATVPQAEKYLGRVDVNVERFEKIMSKDGYEINTPEAFELFVKLSNIAGSVEYRDGMIIMRRDEKSKSQPRLENKMYIPDEFQMTGVIEIKGNQEITMVGLQWWNSQIMMETWESIFLLPGMRKLWLGPHYYDGRTDMMPPNGRRLYLGDPLPFGLKVKNGKAALFLNFGAKPDITQEFVWREGDGFAMGGMMFGEKTELRISKLKFSYLPQDVGIEEPMVLPTLPVKATSQPTSAEATTSRPTTATSSPVDW